MFTARRRNERDVLGVLFVRVRVDPFLLPASSLFPILLFRYFFSPTIRRVSGDVALNVVTPRVYVSTISW